VYICRVCACVWKSKESHRGRKFARFTTREFKILLLSRCFPTRTYARAAEIFFNFRVFDLIFSTADRGRQVLGDYSFFPPSPFLFLAKECQIVKIDAREVGKTSARKTPLPPL